MVFVPIMHDASSMSRYMKNWKNCNELLNDLMVLAVFDSQNIRTGENGDHLISQHNSGAYSFPGLLWPPCLTCSCGYRFSKEVKQVDRNTYKQNTLLFWSPFQVHNFILDNAVVVVCDLISICFYSYNTDKQQMNTTTTIRHPSKSFYCINGSALVKNL